MSQTVRQTVREPDSEPNRKADVSKADSKGARQCAKAVLTVLTVLIPPVWIAGSGS